MGLIIGGIIVICIGVFLWVANGKKAEKSAKLQLLDTTPIKDIIENFTSITDSMGKGSFSNYVEVKGTAYSDNEILSELTGEALLYSETRVIHEYESLEVKTDNNGKKRKEWVPKEDTVASNNRWAVDFGVKDESGFMLIDPTKSQLHTEHLFEKFEPEEEDNLAKKVSGFAKLSSPSSKAKRTIGYRYREVGIKLGSPLYVAGNANDRNGELKISMSNNKEDDFIVSVKSKDQLLNNLSSAAKGLKIGAYILWAGGAALLIYGIISI